MRELLLGPGCLGLAFCLAYASTFGALTVYGQPASAPADPPAETPQVLRITIRTNPWGIPPSVLQRQAAPEVRNSGSSVFTVPGTQANRPSSNTPSQSAPTDTNKAQVEGSWPASQRNGGQNQVQPFSLDLRNPDSKPVAPESPRLPIARPILPSARTEGQSTIINQKSNPPNLPNTQTQTARNTQITQSQQQNVQSSIISNSRPQTNPAQLPSSTQQAGSSGSAVPSQPVPGSPPMSIQNMQKLAGPLDIWGAVTRASTPNPMPQFPGSQSRQSYNPLSMFDAFMNQGLNRQWSFPSVFSGQINQPTHSSHQQPNQQPAQQQLPVQQPQSQPGVQKPAEPVRQPPQQSVPQETPQPAQQPARRPIQEAWRPPRQPDRQPPKPAKPAKPAKPTQAPWQPPKRPPLQPPKPIQEPTQQSGQAIQPPPGRALLPAAIQRNQQLTQPRQQETGQLVRTGQMGNFNMAPQQYLGMGGNPLAWQMANEFQNQEFQMPWYLQQQMMSGLGGNPMSPQGIFQGSQLPGATTFGGFSNQANQRPVPEVSTLPPTPPPTPSPAERRQLAQMMAMSSHYERNCNQPLAMTNQLGMGAGMAPPAGEPMACSCYPRIDCESVQFMYITPQTVRECGSRITGYVCCCENARTMPLR